jgi:DNA-binding NarL/FixJ family response regulator
LQIVGDASDGLEAVRKAEELQPDLFLLDVGLPKSKILFVTQESPDEIVQEAFNLGASSYVVKTRTGSDLLAAVESVRQGKQFVSSGSAARDFIVATDGQALRLPLPQ